MVCVAIYHFFQRTDDVSGQGSYRYSNPTFSYDGDWVNGCKHGRGRFMFSDGGFIEAEFVDGEITGTGRRVWADGKEYSGEFYMGEMNGTGSSKSACL